MGRTATFLHNLLARSRARNNNEKDPPSVLIGGRSVAVHPMGIESAVRLVLLMAPYIAAFEKHGSDIAVAVATDRRRRGRPGTLQAVIRSMTAGLQHAPGDVVEMVALFLGLEKDWVAEHATAAEIVAALPVIDQVNNIAGLVRCAGLLGFVPGPPAEEELSDG